MRAKKSRLILMVIGFGYAFLYLPIMMLIVFSFNESRLVTVWSRFSTKWYYELLHNQSILKAAWVSLQVAIISATIAVIVGTLAAIVITRFKSLRGRTLFNGLLTAPMVMPDVITGLALLLLFVALEQSPFWPFSRGISTITIAHTTLAIAYVVVIITSRLAEFDRSLEEAALDLGAHPMMVFFRITLPLITPSLIAGWLLAFTISLDDVVIASFVSGAGSTTLPMIVFSSVRWGVTPQINALATIIVSLVTLGVIIAGLLINRQQRLERILNRNGR
ncbi:MAG: ABC transporter permease subunit [Alphaproteobacteria bacterium]|nr:ABC transporter permease subunit [Alphaproteobacteria bacterium]